MPTRAHVHSIEAIESFRATLITYTAEATLALDEVREEVIRTRIWLMEDQRACWESQIKRRSAALQMAKQALLSARMSELRSGTEPQRDLRRAERALREAEEKLALLRQWERQYDSRVEPIRKRLDRLHNVLVTDMPRASSSLRQASLRLRQYTEGAPPPPAAPPVASGCQGDDGHPANMTPNTGDERRDPPTESLP